MKKKIIVFSIMILCGISVYAQNKIDRVTFEKLVDYANCQYLMAFIEKHDAGKDYIKNTYEKTIKPELQKATLESLEKVPNIQKIKSLFPNNSNNLALNLAKKIEEKKNHFKENLSDNELIEILISKDWNNVDLQAVAKLIQADIKSKIVTVNTGVTENNPVNDLNTALTTINSTETKEQPTNSNFQSFLWGILLLELVIILVFSYFLFRLWNRCSKLKNSLLEFQKLFNDSTKKTGNSNQIITKSIQSKIPLDEKDIYAITDVVVPRVLDCIKLELKERKTNSVVPVQANNIQQQTNNNSPKDNNLYFASKSERQLTDQLSNSNNASFKVYAVNVNDAKFEYIGSVRNENWFEGICTIENAANDNLSDKKQINTTQPGTVKKENNNWVVSKPAKIKFI